MLAEETFHQVCYICAYLSDLVRIDSLLPQGLHQQETLRQHGECIENFSKLNGRLFRRN